MRLYLDNCSIQRPLDSKLQPRIILEAEAILVFLDLVDSGQVEIVSSETLGFEIGRSPINARKEFALEVLSKSALHVDTNERIEERSRDFVADGIKPLDALHLASAMEANADYFCTCDDKFLKKAKSLALSSLKVVSPLELIAEIEDAPTTKAPE